MNDKDARTRLINAAMPLFATKGFKGVSVKEISESAGVNSALINYYFKSKVGLYEAVLEAQFSQFNDLLFQHDWSTMDPVEKIRQFFLNFARIHRTNPYLRRLMTGELNHPSPCLEHFAQKYISKFSSCLVQTIVEGMAKGQFREDINPSYAVMILVGMVNYYFVAEPIVSKFIFKGKLEDAEESFALQAIQICFEGILRPGYKAEG